MRVFFEMYWKYLGNIYMFLKLRNLFSVFVVAKVEYHIKISKSSQAGVKKNRALNVVILLVSHRSPPKKTNAIKCRRCRVCLVVCASAVSSRDLCGDQSNAVCCRPVQMPFTQKHDTRASHAAVPKGRRRPLSRTLHRSPSESNYFDDVFWPAR